MRVSKRALLAALAAGIAFSGCGGGDKGPQARAVESISKDVLPPTILDLQVGDENAAELMKGSEATFIDRIGLFSLRRDELLHATLQISRFSDDADWGDIEFRRKVARQILEAGAELPTYRMGQDTVYLAVGVRQTTAVWFEGAVMFVMAAREEYERPRALLRELVKLEVSA